MEGEGTPSMFYRAVIRLERLCITIGTFPVELVCSETRRTEIGVHGSLETRMGCTRRRSGSHACTTQEMEMTMTRDERLQELKRLFEIALGRNIEKAISGSSIHETGQFIQGVAMLHAEIRMMETLDP